MLRRRLAAAALAALAAALLGTPGVASGAQAGDQALVRVAHFAPGLPKGDVYVIYVNGRLQLKGEAYTVAVFRQLTDVKAALLTDDMSRLANGRSKVRLIQAIPGEAAVDLVSGGDELISNARFPSASDYQEVPAGTVDVEVRKAGSDQILAKANNLKLPSGSSPGGWHYALLLLVGGGLAAATGFAVRQRRSSG